MTHDKQNQSEGATTFRKIRRRDILKVGNSNYIKESAQPSKERFIPIYFAEISRAELQHDTPVMGAYTVGEWDTHQEGPYRSESRAEGVIANARRKTDMVSFEFSGRVISQMVLESKIASIIFLD